MTDQYCGINCYHNTKKKMQGLMPSWKLRKVCSCGKFAVTERRNREKNKISQFSRERKRENYSQRIGTGADERYKSKWFCFKSLMFLTDRNTPTGTIDTEVSIIIFYSNAKPCIKININTHIRLL